MEKVQGPPEKSGITSLGLRVWEPHEDACPHVHALLYVRPEQVPVVDRHLRGVCPDPEDSRERIASILS
ncbi:replication endonuclease [Pseudoroseomonas wenyumeiae]